MRKMLFAAVAVAAVATGMIGAPATAATFGPSLQLQAAVGDNVEQAAYIIGGRRHCWYWEGWHGPGWYWCGYARRAGIGWGGGEGWNGWRRGVIHERREIRHERREFRHERRERRHERREHRREH